MTGATRVQLVPPVAWDEPALLNAARGYGATGKPVRPGDAVGAMVVVAVEPAPGAILTDATEVVILPTPPRADAALVDVLVLLDVSESMGLPWDAKQSRLDAARTSLAAFLAAPGASVSTVTLMEYAKEARVVDGPAPPSRIDVGATPRPAGPSRTADALDQALEQLSARMDPARARVVFLLTDGVGDVAQLRAAAARAARLKVAVHCIVFAPEVDDAFEELAGQTGGSFQRAGYPLTIEFEHEPGV